MDATLGTTGVVVDPDATAASRARFGATGPDKIGTLGARVFASQFFLVAVFPACTDTSTRLSLACGPCLTPVSLLFLCSFPLHSEAPSPKCQILSLSSKNNGMCPSPVHWQVSCIQPLRN